MLDVQGLTVGYGPSAVVRDLSLHVDAGEVVALLGPNGAGKTTVLRTIAGLLAPSAGSVLFRGHPVRQGQTDQLAGRGIGFVPDDRGVFFQLTVSENLRLSRRRRGSAVTLEEVLEHFPQLRPLMSRKAGLLSGGEQQMLGIARALLSDPLFLMIDEMSLGLAPIIADRMIRVVRELARERQMAVLLVEQHVALALSHADRAYVLSHGNATFDGRADTLKNDTTGLLEASYLGVMSSSAPSSLSAEVEDSDDGNVAFDDCQ